MSHSYAEQTDITCTNCNHQFTFDVWLIVDAAERPDLLDRVRAGTLHQVACPNCQQVLGEADAPLLIYRPGNNPPLVFSPAQQTTQEQDQQQAIGLVNHLRAALGGAWRDEWLANGLPVMPRQLVPQALDDFEGTLRQLQAMQQRAVQQGRGDMPPELVAILHEFTQPPRDARDMPRRMELCRRALELLPREQNPQLWAALQNELANSLAQNPLGNRANNLEQAIHHYSQALEVRTRAAFPEQWAATQHNLANAYLERIRGERAANLEQAIHHYSQALEVYTRAAFPERWAGTQNNLASAYIQRIRGERADNLEQAIHHCQQALAVYTRASFPVDWAMTQHNLASAYRNRIRGERAANLEQAIHHFSQALEVYTRAAFPERWATTQHNLASAYANRIRGERAANLEQAIHHYSQALEVYTRAAFPERWATTQHNLASAYIQRIRGERAANLEQAIHHYAQALEVRTRAAFPEQWATTQHNLAAAYIQRIRGERAANLEQAIHHFSQALEVRTRAAFPEQWATTQHNLAAAYIQRIRGEREDNFEQAIHHCQQALAVYTRAAFPERWAGTQHNLANAYRNRIRGERAANLEQAIHHYAQALEVYTRADFPFEWAATQNNLANAYRNRIRGERAANLEQAIHHCQQALEVYTAEGFPTNHLQTQRNLGNLHFGESQWQEAHQAYAAALAVGRDLLRAAYSEAGRQAEIAETAALFARAAYCLLQLGEYGAALVQLEAGKTRLLAEALALSDTDTAMLPAEQQRTLADLRQRIRELETEARLPPDTPARRPNQEIRADLREARAELNTLIETIRADHPDFMPEGLDLLGILALVPEDGALVAPLFTSQESAVFVVPPGVETITEEHVIWLADFTTDDLNTLLRGTEDEPGWLRVYLRRRSDAELLTALEAITGQVWDRVLAPVHDRLQALGARRVILMPQDGLGLLPLHAAWRSEDGARRYLLDDYIVRYAPSAYALDAAQRRLTGRDGQRSALVAGVSEYGQLNDLPNTRPEAETIAALFDTAALVDAQATPQAVLAGASGAAYLHMACHGAFAWGAALDSALVLTGDEPLTLADILGQLDLDAARLVTLSACETGITDVQRSPDEYVGLPAGFMQAGAPGVVSSLWTVEDRSTALLMERFYRNHLDGMPPAEALREAQVWLRDITRAELGEYLEAQYRMSAEHAHDAHVELLMQGGAPDDRPYAHPYFWAAFTLNGV